MYTVSILQALCENLFQMCKSQIFIGFPTVGITLEYSVDLMVLSRAVWHVCRYMFMLIIPIQCLFPAHFTIPPHIFEIVSGLKSIGL